ncbi:MAG: hypothetical protein LBQ54_05385 [Planctomycetaceae bacterium]|nr:hypothetical protein [Planctomycetaceae bacterium]
MAANETVPCSLAAAPTSGRTAVIPPQKNSKKHRPLFLRPSLFAVLPLGVETIDDTL